MTPAYYGDGIDGQSANAARRLRREIAASLIAVKPHLDKPYPDDPRWTPWTRFIERTLERVDELAKPAGADCPDELQRRADEIYAADRAQDFNHGKDDDADA